MSSEDQDKELSHVRSLLESVAMLEAVAADREATIEQILGFLSSHGMDPPELAERLDVSEASIRVLLERDEPRPPHQRIGISEETIQKLKRPGAGHVEASGELPTDESGIPD